MDNGLVHVYTGNGKGKTTAAIGLAIRALGRGKKVFMIQFLKTSDSGEINILKKMEPDFQLFRFEKKRGFVWNLTPLEKAELQKDINKAFEFTNKVLKEGLCDVIILDEIMGVLSNNLVNVMDIISAIKTKCEGMEVVLTGRNVPSEIIELADYVSEIKSIKHPFEKGIGAREGIEF